MKTYQVDIVETLKMTVDVEADSREKAECIVNEQWHKSDYVLDADNFTGVEFKAKTPSKNKNYER